MGQHEILRSAQDDRGRARDDTSGTPADTAARAVFALVLTIALGLRVWGLDWQLPWQFHPDEGHYTWKALDLIGDESLNPKYFRNPSLFTYVLYGQYRLLGFQPPKADDQAATGDGLLRPPSGVAFVGRLDSAILGTATAAAVGWIGWRLLGPWSGVLAAAFLGLAFIHVRDSHYATNDVPATFLLVLSVAASLEVLRRPTARAYLLAGLLGGLATSTKYNAGLFFVPLVVASLATLTQPSPRGRGPMGPLPLGEGWVRVLSLLVVAALASILAYLAGTPYTLLDFPRFWGDFRTQMRLGGEGWEGQVTGPSALLYLQALGHGIGWVMFALALIGLVLLARRRPAEAAVIAAFPIAYLLFMLRTELFFARFALPIVPFLCLLAAGGVVLLVERMARLRLRPVVGALLATVALAQPSWGSVLHNVLVTHDDTRVLAARWAVANIPPDAKVALEEYTIRDRRPRAYGGPSWTLDTDLFNVNDVRAADPTAPLRGPHRYFILSSFQYQRFGGDGVASDPRRAFYEALAREGQLVAEFSPGRGGTPVPFDLEDLYTPFWNLEQYERPGPTIRIYTVGP